MRKIIPLIIIGFLMLSGTGAIAIQEENSIIHEHLMQPQIEIIARGGLGVTINVLNHGTEPFEEPIALNVTIIAPLMLIRAKNNLFINPPIPAGGSVTNSTGFVLGFGLCVVNIVAEVGDTPDVYEANATGLVFWPLVIIKATSILIE